MEKEVQQLRSQLDDLRASAKSAEVSQVGLEDTVNQFRKMLESSEREILDLQTVKQQLVSEKRELVQRWELMNEDRLRDTEVIAELEARNRELEVEKVIPNGHGTLDTQLRDVQPDGEG